jgi:hypothetical protein
MAQMLGTFSKLEESRFEAFQRSSFQADAIEGLVAACLCHRHGVAIGGQADAKRSGCGGGGGGVRPRRKLEDLVAAPGPTVAQDIVLVVSTLAKIYAQRLAASAVQVAQQRRRQQGQPRPDGDSPSRPAVQGASVDRPLEPEDVLEAYRLRSAAGMDPGFYLQPHDGISAGRIAPSIGGGSGGLGMPGQFAEAAALEQNRRLAALAAQDEYERSRKSGAAAAPETQESAVVDDPDRQGDVEMASEEQEQSQKQEEDVVMTGTAPPVDP